jgi:hypothetical protein
MNNTKDNLSTNPAIDGYTVLAGRCSSCQFWEKIPETTYSVDMGKCKKLSGTYNPEKYPDTEITGIESTPICIHDGSGFMYETKSWFGCVHYNAR